MLALLRLFPLGAKTNLMKNRPINPEDVLRSLEERLLLTGKPLVVNPHKSRGLTLYDAWHEKEFIDFCNDEGRRVLTYNRPEFAEPEFKERAASLAASSFPTEALYTTIFAEYARDFFELIFPERYPRVAFAVSHEEAVEFALKAAFDWKAQKNGRRGISQERLIVVGIEEGYYGLSGYGLSLAASSGARREAFYPRFDFPALPNPKIVFSGGVPSESDTAESELKAINRLKELLSENPEGIAAVVFEPIQLKGGDNYFRPEFFRELRNMADEYGFLLIADETSSGFFTVAHPLAMDRFEADADIVVFGGKAALSGIAANERLEEVVSVFVVPGRLESRLAPSMVELLAGLKTIELIETEELAQNVKRIENILIERIKALLSLSARCSNSRAMGSLAAFDLPNIKEREALVKKLFENGLIVSASGEKTIGIRLPLDAAPKEIHMGFDLLESVFSAFQP